MHRLTLQGLLIGVTLMVTNVIYVALYVNTQRPIASTLSMLLTYVGIGNSFAAPVIYMSFNSVVRALIRQKLVGDNTLSMHSMTVASKRNDDASCKQQPSISQLDDSGQSERLLSVHNADQFEPVESFISMFYCDAQETYL